MAALFRRVTEVREILAALISEVTSDDMEADFYEDVPDSAHGNVPEEAPADVQAPARTEAPAGVEAPEGTEPLEETASPPVTPRERVGRYRSTASMASPNEDFHFHPLQWKTVRSRRRPT